MRALSTLKQTTLQVAHSMGIDHQFADSAWRRERLLILCYHGISLEDEHEWKPSLFMSPRDFESRLVMLRRQNYTVLPLAHALTRLYARELPPRAVTITFDDGLYDFYKQAFPLLKKYGYPATVYLSTFYCDYNRPVFPVACRYLAWKAGRPDEAPALMGNAEIENYSAAQKDLVLASMPGIDEMRAKRILHLMTPDEVRQIAAAGMDVQLHTHRHRTPRDRTAFMREIDDNRSRIAQITGSEPKHFCYPSGVTDPNFLPWLTEQRVISATTCMPGLASVESNPLLLPRFVDNSAVSPVTSEGWLSGLASFFPRRTATAGHA